jgi:vancomycin resistance protein VanJ
MKTHNANWPRDLKTTLVFSYALAVIGWFTAYTLTGDDFWLLAMVNAFAIYLFVPLPLVILTAALIRRRAAWIAALSVTMIALGTFGRDVTPPAPRASANADAPTMTVMTYNVLYLNTDAAPLVANILNANPDLVAFQELTPLVAQRLEREIGERYPHRTPVRPIECAAEVAVWSRYPLQVEDVNPDFLCRVRSVLVDFGGRSVRVVNVHGWPFTGIDPQSIERSLHWRQAQIEMILNRVEGQPEPLILMGDLNATPANAVYRTVSVRLIDAFREAGWGLGHTWPTTGSKLRGIPYPNRLVRIDHIFHSSEWQADAAWVAPWDGVSDHHAVVARLRLIAN